MKSFKFLGLITLFFAVALFAISCGDNTQTDAATTSGEQTEAAQTNDGGSHDGHNHAGHDHAGHDHAGHNHGATTAHGASAEFTAAYVCPMHCKDSGSDTAGKCPVCEMDYVAQADHVKDGHTH